MTTRSSKCKACDARTTSHTGYCRWCKSKRHRGYARIEDERLVVDQAGGAWWIWDARGDVLVAGKPTKDAAIITLGAGAIEEKDNAAADKTAHARKKTGRQLDAEIAEALGHRHKLRPVEGLQIPEDSRRALTRFWHEHPDLRRGCLDKYGFDPIDEEAAYWRHGLAEPDHHDVLRAVQRDGGVFSLPHVRRWKIEELSHKARKKIRR